VIDLFQALPVITMNGSVRIKTCDLDISQQQHSQVMAQARQQQQQQQQQQSDGENPRAVSNQYSFV
jgi:hypothetical protein